jgi:hypothetical protein
MKVVSNYGYNISMSGDDTYDHVVRETGVEWGRALDTLHLFRGQRNVQRHEVFLKLLDLPATDDREHVRSLLQMVCNSNCNQGAVCVNWNTETFGPPGIRTIMTYLL